MNQPKLALNEERLDRVRDAILGISYWTPKSDAFLYPFLDYLFLLFQERCVLWIRREDKELCFPSSATNLSTLPSLSRKTGVAVPGVEEGIPPCYLEVSGETQKEYSTDLRALLEHEEVGDAKRRKAFKQRLGDSFQEVHSRQEAEEVEVPRKIEQGTISAYLKPMCNVVEQALQPVLESEFHQIPGTKLGNIFAAVHVKQVLPDDAQQNIPDGRFALLMTASTIEAIGEATKREAQSGYEELPVEGLFEGIPPNTVGFGFTEWLKKLERRMGFDPHSDVLSRYHGMFRVPVHVNGVPWVILFRLMVDGDEDERWYNNFNFYREVLPRLASNIRTGSKEVYVRLLAEKLEEHLQAPFSTPQKLAEAVTKDWRLIAQVYPFAPVALAEGSHGGSVVVLPESGIFSIDVQTGESFFRRDLTYDPLEPDDIVAACQRAVDDYRQTVKKTEDRSVATTTHLLRTPLEKLRGAVAEVKDKGQRRGLRNQIESLIRLEEFSNYIVEPDRKERREPPSRTVSPGEFLRVVEKDVAGIIDVHKLESYMDRKAQLIKEMDESGQLRVELARQIASEHTSREVKYFPDQLKVVIDGLLGNAIRYCSSVAPSITVSLSTPLANEDGFFISVRNTSDRTLQELQQLAQDLTEHARSGWIGISIIHHSCEACFDKSQPHWEVRGKSAPPHELIAKAKVATLD